MVTNSNKSTKRTTTYHLSGLCCNRFNFWTVSISITEMPITWRVNVWI